MLANGKRFKTLNGLAAKRDRMHRYTAIRWIVGVTFTVGVAALPLLGVLRLDLWSGRNFWLGEEVGFVDGVKAFAFPFLAINIAIVVVSRFLGRWLCGFVCPVGNLSRFSEWLRWRFRKKGRVVPALTVLAVCFLLSAITFSFFVDWRVFDEGSPVAVSLSVVFLVGTTGVLFGTVHGLGVRFCRDYCPSGVYFAVLGPTTRTGIDFAHPEACTDCKACEAVCPVDLKPREMEGQLRAGTGFYPDGLTNYANCLRCGDCVAACESTTARCSDPTPLRMGWLSAESVRRQEETQAS